MISRFRSPDRDLGLWKLDLTRFSETGRLARKVLFASCAIAGVDKEGVPCAPVLTVNEAIAHPHLNERKTVRWVDDPLLGRVAIPAMPVKFSAWPDRTDLRSARLGDDNERILRHYLGLSDERIRELYENCTLVRDKTIGRLSREPLCDLSMLI